MKLTKSETKYTPKAMKPSERCKVCEHFHSNESCDIVAGRISAQGWCNRFHRK